MRENNHPSHEAEARIGALLERVRSGEEPVFDLEDVTEELGLNR